MPGGVAAPALGGTTLTDRLRKHPSVHLLAAVLLAALLASANDPADAASVRSEHARAAGVMHQLDLLRTRRDQAALRERAARAELHSARLAVARAQAMIDADRRSLADAQASLARMLVSNYKGGGQVDAVSYVLASGSFSDLVTRVDVLDHLTASGRELIGQIAADQRRLEAAQKALRARASEAAAAAASATRARQRLDAAVARSQRLLAHVDATIQGLLRHERARRSQLADSHPASTGDGGSSSSGGQPAGDVFYGECSWYGPGFAGHRTADGEIFDPHALTAASPWLPFGTQLRVTDLATGLTVQVRVNDRGPFGRGVLDLSAHAARIIHLTGWQRVRIRVLPATAAALAVPQITL